MSVDLQRVASQSGYGFANGQLKLPIVKGVNVKNMEVPYEQTAFLPL
jgi:hypothetical protein